MADKEQYLDVIRQRYPDLPVEGAVVERRGQFNDVLILNNEVVFRFPRSEHVVDELAIEKAVLNRIQAALPLPVPRPVYSSMGSSEVGEVFVGYRYIPGQPFTVQRMAATDPYIRSGLARQLGSFLLAMHDFPAEYFGFELPVRDRKEDWQRVYTAISELLMPHMRPDAREQVKRQFEEAFDAPGAFAFTPRLRHGDFGPGNILFDEATQQISGVVDFSSIALGDPAVDIASVSLYGWDFVEKMALHYSDILTMLPRARFYRSTFALQEALAGIQDGDQEAYLSGMEDYL